MTIFIRIVFTSILLAGLFHVEAKADGGLAKPTDPVTITVVKVRISDRGAWSPPCAPNQPAQEKGICAPR